MRLNWFSTFTRKTFPSFSYFVFSIFLLGNSDSLNALNGETTKGKHIELGDVEWYRNFDQAKKISSQSGKPLFVLFQEVPGCLGCQQYGKEVLSHSLIVEAIEELFIPVAVFNNREGEDRKVLDQYKEPSWNFQVVRYLDKDGKDIIPREDQIWTVAETAKRMVSVLKAYHRPVPKYLSTLAIHEVDDNLKTAAFAMYCFWEGEAKLGSLQGVVSTESGWMEGREVVKLRYDPEQINWDTLVASAEQFKCANKIYSPDANTKKEAEKISHHPTALYSDKKYRPAKEPDQKFMIKRTALKQLDLSETQAVKVNAALKYNDLNTALEYLSPRQIEQLKAFEKK
ncbi:thioredoxin family protein [Puniceicoccaceae bacterium K14]|nr:thioredoxin family protein [Puniceicoccaceae bacterium K14]